MPLHNQVWYKVTQGRLSDTLLMQIYLYTEPACRACIDAKYFLKVRGISFDERNGRANPEYLRFLTDDIDSCTLPTLVAGNTIIDGFDREEYQHLHAVFKLKRHRRSSFDKSSKSAGRRSGIPKNFGGGKHP